MGNDGRGKGRERRKGETVGRDRKESLRVCQGRLNNSNLSVLEKLNLIIQSNRKLRPRGLRTGGSRSKMQYPARFLNPISVACAAPLAIDGGGALSTLFPSCLPYERETSVTFDEKTRYRAIGEESADNRLRRYNLLETLSYILSSHGPSARDVVRTDLFSVSPVSASATAVRQPARNLGRFNE